MSDSPGPRRWALVVSVAARPDRQRGRDDRCGSNGRFWPRGRFGAIPTPLPPVWMQSLNTCRRSTLPGPLPPVEVVRRTLELVKKARSGGTQKPKAAPTEAYHHASTSHHAGYTPLRGRNVRGLSVSASRSILLRLLSVSLPFAHASRVGDPISVPCPIVVP